MATKGTKYLDLDEVDSETPEFVIKLGGKEHQLTPISLRDWIANTKMMQNIRGADGDIEAEADIIIGMITRSFKTLEPEILKTMPLFKLNKILAFARANNGEDDADKEVAAEAEANPTAAPAAEALPATSSPQSTSASSSAA